MSDKLPPKILVIEYDELLNAALCNTIERYWFDVTRVIMKSSNVMKTLMLFYYDFNMTSSSVTMILL